VLLQQDAPLSELLEPWMPLVSPGDRAEEHQRGGHAAAEMGFKFVGTNDLDSTSTDQSRDSVLMK